jgi:hypothetical protein
MERHGFHLTVHLLCQTHSLSNSANARRICNATTTCLHGVAVAKQRDVNDLKMLTASEASGAGEACFESTRNVTEVQGKKSETLVTI